MKGLKVTVFKVGKKVAVLFEGKRSNIMDASTFGENIPKETLAQMFPDNVSTIEFDFLPNSVVTVTATGKIEAKLDDKEMVIGETYILKRDTEQDLTIGKEKLKLITEKKLF